MMDMEVCKLIRYLVPYSLNILPSSHFPEANINQERPKLHFQTALASLQSKMKIDIEAELSHTA